MMLAEMNLGGRGLTKMAVGSEVAPLLASDSLSDFQRCVYTALCQVPAGKVTTYRDLARSIDCGSSQAVGQALKRNPFAPKVPCHRVVRNDRSLGGFLRLHSAGESRK